MQIIFHIDLNAFFANAEIAVNPSLKGKPVVMSGESRRGIVSTASY
jgi:DNA polymerase-4